MRSKSNGCDRQVLNRSRHNCPSCAIERGLGLVSVAFGVDARIRIILDKSVVVALGSPEIDALDRYYFQIVPPILRNEILADLTKTEEIKGIKGRISANSYKISGNNGLSASARQLLGHSLIGNEAAMDGRFIPADQALVRTPDGKLGLEMDSIAQEKTIARWERGEFLPDERTAIGSWREAMSRPVNVYMYTNTIGRSGFPLPIPKDETHLAELVDEILHDKRTQASLIYLLFRQWSMPHEFQIKVLVHRSSLGNPPIATFAPYAAFCSRVNLLWALGHSNKGMFTLDVNDRKDMEYCYYLPHCETFASNDRKHARLVPFLLRPEQRFIKGADLKTDLLQLSTWWNSMNREDQIGYLGQHGNGPPESSGSITWDLWATLRADASRPMPLEMLDMTLVDSTLPEEQQVPFTLREMLLRISDEAKQSTRVPIDEAVDLYKQQGSDPTAFAGRRSLLSRERILKLFPHLKDSDLD